jgi:hypothetical protein
MFFDDKRENLKYIAFVFMKWIIYSYESWNNERISFNNGYTELGLDVKFYSQTIFRLNIYL